MPDNKNNAFRSEGLTKTYCVGETEIYALRGVDIEIPQGELIVLLGPSGSGKSTFLNIIGGLDSPSSGKVLFGDQDLGLLSAHELTLYRRQHIGFIFQSYNLIPSLTALENVALVTEIAENPLDPLDALAAVGLAQRAHHFPAQLSGGEQQRVAIARALAKQPEVMLCDEPTGALDSQTGIVVLKALIDANEKSGASCIIITHNVSIAQLAHRVIHFADGCVSRVTVNDVRKQPEDVDW